MNTFHDETQKALKSFERALEHVVVANGNTDQAIGSLLTEKVRFDEMQQRVQRLLQAAPYGQGEDLKRLHAQATELDRRYGIVMRHLVPIPQRGSRIQAYVTYLENQPTLYY
ncbi:hypothetical protein HYS48_02185 [Candidatus Woesearchaeota archaeon]|nr:hypothetical protein [Candidatus Woesearchaeota archaeon]